MSELYNYNDWRGYLAHKEGSKYDWSGGKNPSEYNHDYWEKNKKKILAQRAKHKEETEKNSSGKSNSKGKSDSEKSLEELEAEHIRDFGGAGVGYKAKKDGTTGENASDYENDTDWSDELTADEKKNVAAHNKTVEDNIAAVTKTVNDYISANKGSLSKSQIENLQKSLETQVSIAREQMINTKNSDDYDYVMGLRKKAAHSDEDGTDFNDLTDLGAETLEHFGIPGMKWGVRRYQNKDGSLTAAGRTRYAGGKVNSSEESSGSSSGGSAKMTNAQKLLDGDGAKDIKDPIKRIEAITEDCWNPSYRKALKDPKEQARCDAAADLGLKARYSDMLEDVDSDAEWYMGRGMTKEKAREQVIDSHREWFLYEDQTIGEPMIADLINQGYSAKQCEKLIKMVESDVKSSGLRGYGSDVTTEKASNAIFNVFEGNYKDSLVKFAEECEKVKNEEPANRKAGFREFGGYHGEVRNSERINDDDDYDFDSRVDISKRVGSSNSYRNDDYDFDKRVDISRRITPRDDDDFDPDRRAGVRTANTIRNRSRRGAKGGK